MKAIIFYDSLGGNTEKVARTIFETTKKQLPATEIVKVNKNTECNFLDYDLIFIGSPVVDWLPTQTMIDFVKKNLKKLNENGKIKPSAPMVPGKFSICFGTYGGPHIGKNEAEPMTMWFRSALEHMGFLVLDSWHTVGQFRKMDNMKELNTKGRLGNIENRPNESDLLNIKNRVEGTLASLVAWHTPAMG